MSSPRLPRNTRKEPTAIGYVVERAARDRFVQIAKRSGLSAAGLFDAIALNMPLDEHGYPVWLPERPGPKDGELPIDSP